MIKKAVFYWALLIVLGTGITTAVRTTQAVNVQSSDLIRANIEALADDEVESGYVHNITETMIEGEPHINSQGHVCIPMIFEITCRGFGGIWCEHKVSISQPCQ